MDVVNSVQNIFEKCGKSVEGSNTLHVVGEVPPTHYIWYAHAALAPTLTGVLYDHSVYHTLKLFHGSQRRCEGL